MRLTNPPNPPPRLPGPVIGLVWFRNKKLPSIPHCYTISSSSKTLDLTVTVMVATFVNWIWDQLTWKLVWPGYIPVYTGGAVLLLDFTCLVRHGSTSQTDTASVGIHNALPQGIYRWYWIVTHRVLPQKSADGISLGPTDYLLGWIFRINLTTLMGTQYLYQNIPACTCWWRIGMERYTTRT